MIVLLILFFGVVGTVVFTAGFGPFGFFGGLAIMCLAYLIRAILLETFE